MKLSKLFNSLPKRFAAAATLALAILFPVATMAAGTVNMEGALGVSNVTTGETTYTASTNASYDQVVKYQVYYHNTELPDSGKVAQNVHVKIALPSTAGKTQVATATITADNANTVTSSATVNLDRADAYLQFMPGSAVWRHNTGTNQTPVWTEAKVSDSVVSGGLTLENEQPCYNYAATVTVLARVMVPGVSIDKYVRIKGTTAWTTTVVAKPGETVQYEIAYKNTGNSTQNDVAIRDQLPAGVTYVAGSALLKNTNFLSGTKLSDAIVTNGVIAGTYLPGAAGYVMFDATLPAANALECGANKLRNIAYAQPSGMNYYYNTADVTINKDCEQPKTPVYSCDLLDVSSGSNRTVTAIVHYTGLNGASLKMVTYTWGDSSTPLVTDKTSANHQYNADGTYTISTKLLFNVNGTDKYAADSESCVKTVTFTTPQTPETPPVLPNTGAGSVIGIFGVVSALGAIGYRLFLGRKFTTK
jgi:uncharacterized repeat protein (TIGR01451 family)